MHTQQVQSHGPFGFENFAPFCSHSNFLLDHIVHGGQK